MNIRQNAGQLFFSTMSHSLYDMGVYKIASPYIWQCPEHRIRLNYRQHLSSNHLEVGVGTGYWLQETLDTSGGRRLVLMDLNCNCLQKSSRRLQRHRPESHRINLLEDEMPKVNKFDSIGMNFVLHCIKGRFSERRILFEKIHDLLNENGVFFGATLLSTGVNRSRLSRQFMKLLNYSGIFHNAEDDRQEFTDTFNSVFTDTDIRIEGSAVIFSGRRGALRPAGA